MSLGVWAVAGHMAMLFTAAVAARFAPAYIMPDMLVVVTTFVALRRTAVQATLLALMLGYLLGLQVPAPAGLNALALSLCTLGAYLASGQVAASGRLAFGPLCGVAAMVHAGATKLILVLDGSETAFASTATALLVPGGVVTMLVAWLLYGVMVRLEHQLAPEVPQGLQWR